MHAWHDIFTTRPPAGSAIWVRRYINDTPDVFGYWNADDGTLTCGLGGWLLTDAQIWTWRLHEGLLPPWPVPSEFGGWQDPWLHPPAPIQAVWLRRFAPTTAALSAVWDAGLLGFHVYASPNIIPWHGLYRWKPR